MVNGIRTGDPRGFNEGRSSKFRVGSRVRQTPEEGRRTFRPKRCGNNKDEDNSPKILNDKNHQASSQKFRQLIKVIYDLVKIFIFSLLEFASLILVFSRFVSFRFASLSPPKYPRNSFVCLVTHQGTFVSIYSRCSLFEFPLSSSRSWCMQTSGLDIQCCIG